MKHLLCYLMRSGEGALSLMTHHVVDVSQHVAEGPAHYFSIT